MTDLLIRLFVKDRENIQDQTVREGYGRMAAVVGILCNLLLFILKAAAGIAAASISVLADAFNNLSDMGSSLVTLLGFRLAAKPADRDHPYGHGRLEYLSAFVVAVLILLVGIELLKNSVEKLLHPTALSFTALSVVILAISVLIKLWMFFFNRKLGRRIGSTALTATARDSLSDAVSTAAVLLSVAIMMVWRVNIDAWVGLAVSAFVLWSGIKTARDTISPLLGEPLDRETADRLEREIMSFDGFLGIHDLVVHNYGPGRRFATVHVEVPADLELVKCHEQIDRCEKLIAEQTGIELTIHADPVETDNEVLARTKQVLSEKLKELDPRLSLHDFRMVTGSGSMIHLTFDVILPAELANKEAALRRKIDQLAAQIDPNFRCIISFDPDYTDRGRK